ncbi:MAG: alpha-isopropylmalate synthase regulatory domain-containing protein [Bryobacterales bacterium]
MTIITEKRGSGRTEHRVELVVRASDGLQHWAEESSEGGPFDAMAKCLRACLKDVYPRVFDVKLTDYKVRVLDGHKGTAARVRVLVTWRDGNETWTTVGVSDDVLEASWNALCDSLRLELLRIQEAEEAAVQEA